MHVHFNTIYLHILHTTHIPFEAFAIYYCLALSVHPVNSPFPVLVLSAFSFIPHLSVQIFALAHNLYSACPLCPIHYHFPLSGSQVRASVDRALEDEFDVALLPCQPGTTEGAGCVEGMSAMG